MQCIPVDQEQLRGLPLALRLLLRVHSDAFYSSPKTVLFSRARVGSASE